MSAHPADDDSAPDGLEAAREALRGLLDEAIGRRICSAAQLEIGYVGGPLVRLAAGTAAHPGFAGDTLRVDLSSRFDLASLTKALVTSVVVMRAVQAGRLDAATRLATLLAPGLLHPTLRALPVSDLLRHRSGLPAWRPFFEDVPRHLRGTDAGLERIRTAAAGLHAEPRPSVVYSDPNYILLDWALERLLGASLDALFTTHVVEPLGLRRSTFVDLKRGQLPLQNAVATEVCPWRGGLVRGTVHDDNAWAMGGVSGHAGLFGTAGDVGRIARALLETDASSRKDWLQPEVLHEFWDRRWTRGPQQSDAPGSFVLGWDTPSGARSSAGQLATRERTVGHLGFTGCALWIDRDRAGYVVLLTNRVHPDRSDDRIRDLRPVIADKAWAIIDQAAG